ncbi:hypothetical protein ACNO7P_09320 [Bisgaard Taxon 45]
MSGMVCTLITQQQKNIIEKEMNFMLKKPRKKRIKEKNTEICLKISGGEKESKETWDENIFLTCMKKRGSAVP